MAMPITRNQIMEALLAKLSASGTYRMTGRRNRDPEFIAAADTPALMQVEHSETYLRPSSILPPVRQYDVRAIIYYDVGDNDNAIPSAVINDLLDGIDAALAPDSPSTNRCTLGGLVQSVVISGDIIKAPGDVSGKGLAIVPLHVLVP